MVWICNTCFSKYESGNKLTGLIGQNHKDNPSTTKSGWGGYYTGGKCKTCNGTGRYTVPKNCSHQKGAVHYY